MEAKNHSKITTSFFVWGVADLFFILSVTVAILLGILLPNVQKQLNLSEMQLGLLGFAFFVSFGLMQFITGGLVDSKGPRATLTISSLVASCGLFLLSYADSFAWAMIAQVIAGVGFSIAYVGAIYLAERWFAKELFPLLSGITQMSANIISALALFIMAVTGIISVDFRTITTRLGFIALFLAVLLFIVVRRSPMETQLQPKKILFKEGLIQLFQIPQVWFCVFYFSANFGAFLAFSSLWNIPDSLAYGHSLETATMMSAILRFGGAFGAFASGLFARHFCTCSSAAKWYSTGALCLGAFLIYGPVFPVPITFLIMGVLGFFCGGTALGFPLIAQHIPPSLKGAGFGFMTSIGYLLCALLEYLVGAFLRNAGDVNDFKIALTPLVVILLIGWLCSLKLTSK